MRTYNLDYHINEQYKNYFLSNFCISTRKNEIYQIGFRLAEKLGHDIVYATDYKVQWCGEIIDWSKFDYNSYLKSQGQIKKYERFEEDYEKNYRIDDSLKTVQTLSKRLAALSNPKAALKNHSVYLSSTIITGAGDNYIGV